MPVAKMVINEVPIPKGVDIKINAGKVTVKGPKGELAREFIDPVVTLTKQGEKMIVRVELPRKKQKALAGTWAAHLANMFKGVTQGHEYKMKSVFAHFPIKVSIKENRVHIENFLGERVPRFANIRGKTQIKINGDFLVLTGIDLEDVSQTAANIEQATKVKDRDRRIFQDGIYITHKGV